MKKSAIIPTNTKKDKAIERIIYENNLENRRNNL